MTATDHPDPAPASAQPDAVRVCDVCGRPVIARDKSEYTMARARLVADKGLCVCPSETPAHGPSLI